MEHVDPNGKSVQSHWCWTHNDWPSSAHDIKRSIEPPDRKKISPILQKRQAWKEGRLGHNPNPIVPDAENPVSQNNNDLDEGRRKNEIDYGRFVQGIKNALATSSNCWIFLESAY